jgi:hypothetical protein
MKRSVNGLSLARDARDWLANSHQPRILHVFDRACNLINERREVLSIVTPDIGNGPFNLVIEDVHFSNYINLHAKRPISISSNQLIIGELTIQTNSTILWNPRPDWERLHASRDHIVHQLTQLQITNYLKRGVIDMPLVDHLVLLNHPGLPLTQSLVSNLSIAVAKGDISSAQKITSQLAGLGNGLTPAGDDFIMGAIYAVWIIHPPEIANILAQKIANIAAPLTTSLSAAWLRSAGKGEADVLWHNFFDALIAENAPMIELQITKLLSIGHTSGADALAGFLSACMTYHSLQMAAT